MAVFPEENYSAEALLVEARKGLFRTSRLLSPDGTLAALQDLKQWVAEEIAFEESASTSFGRVLAELWHAEYLDQLPPLLNRFERLACAYFVRRGSVSAFHGFCNAWREGVLRRILLFAEEEPDLNDQAQPSAPYALLGSGSEGRREQTLEESERYYLIWAGETEYFQRYAYRLMALLHHCGLIGKDSSAFPGNTLWRGSLDDWNSFVDAELPQQEQPSRLELFADLRPLCGDQAVGLEATRLARVRLEASRGDAEYLKFAREVVEAPVALGVLGGIRVEKSGEHAGSFNPEEAGLHPLIGAVRLLAAQHSLEAGSTLDRLTALGSLKVLEGPLVERLVASYHLLAAQKIRREIALEHPFVDPAGLTESEREKLTGALEAVRQLQHQLRRTIFGMRGKS